MSERIDSATGQSAEALRLQMERCVDDLAELARDAVEPGQFFAEVLKFALRPGGARHAILWRLDVDAGWERAGELPTALRSESPDRDSDRELLFEIARTSSPRIVRPETPSNGQSSTETLVFSPLRHAGQAIGILQTRHDLLAGDKLSATTYQFFAAIGDITADYLSQLELRQLRLARQTWQKWDRYYQQLDKSSELAVVSAVIANDARSLVECDRISVLVRRGRQYRLQAASGVERVDSRAGAVRSLETISKLVADSRQNLWQTITSVDPIEPGRASQEMHHALNRHATESGAKYFGAIVIDSITGSSTACLAVITFEAFQPSSDWSDRKVHAELVAQRSSAALRNAIEKASIPWVGVWRRIQSGPRILRRLTTLFAVIAIAGLTTGLTLFPAPFSVSGSAELWPDQRRNVFATATSIVDQILVEHGADVHPDQPLIILSDPQLDQEIPKVEGELATLNERLKGVLTARLTGSATESISKSRQLTADEEEIKERLKTLELRRKLLEQRHAALTLRSPIPGKILTWDIRQNLLGRPVDRGQSLLTIGNTAGPWIMEMRIADRDVGFVINARRSGEPDLSVDFQLALDPGKTYHGTVREVALATESDDQGAAFVRVIAAFDRNTIEHLRPGATAIPRIRCGHRSIGYVWLRDLIDAIRVKMLF